MDYKYLFLVLDKETKQLSQAAIEADSLEQATAKVYSVYPTELYCFFVQVFSDVVTPLNPEAARYDQATGFCKIVSRGRRISDD